MSLRNGIAMYSHNCRGGAEKTRYNHVQEARKFCERLKECGYNPQKWQNITNKHVDAVVKDMQSRDLSTSTIKETLSGVRAVANYFHNTSIAESNKAFGIENRVYVSNDNKACSPDYFRDAQDKLSASGNERLSAQIGLCYHLGLRKEEAMKFDAQRDVINNGESVHISAGTKGGRERTFDLTQDQKDAIERVAPFCGGHGSIPEGKSEAQYEKSSYKSLEKNGITKAEGGSFHSFRHAFAQNFYENHTGFACRCQFETREEYEQNAREVREDWRDADRSARQLLKSLLGHGPDRGDVVAQYLGSAHS